MPSSKWTDGLGSITQDGTKVFTAILRATSALAGENSKILGHEVMRALVKVFGWPGFQPVEKSAAEFDTAVFAQCEGKYRHIDYPDFAVEIIKDGEYLFLRETPSGIIHFQLYPGSETVFFCPDRPEEFTFNQNARGKVEAMMINKYSRLERAE